ncbi:MAG: PorT family protein [Bacteroidales bacterium]|nr:PorT family protein [Bacteroidales bacterium]
MRAKLIFFVFFLLPIVSMAQLFTGGLKAGLVVSQVAGDRFSGFNKAGFNAGFWGAWHIVPGFSMQMDLAYIQKGSAQQASESRSDIPQYLLRLNYVEMPIVAHYQWEKWAIEAGISFDFLVGHKETIDFLSNDQGQVWRKMNPASVLGVQYQLTDHWAINLRSLNSILSIRKNSVPHNVRRYSRHYGAYNDALSFGMIYKI